MKFQNLNFIRLILAFMVLISHSYELKKHAEPLGHMIHVATFGSIAVVSFFFVSGYLVTMSLDRHKSPLTFIAHRFARIWPGLVACVFLSIFLGYASGYSYYDREQLIQYLWTNLTLIMGITYEVNGFYPDNFNKSLNGSLWTMPWEIRCYLIILSLYILNFINSKTIINILLISCIVYFFISDKVLFFKYDNVTVGLMLSSFFIGAFYYINNINYKLSIIIFITGLASFAIEEEFKLKQAFFMVTILQIIYLVGFCMKHRGLFLKIDLSYGFYVYAFPIQQYIISVSPNITPLQLIIIATTALIPISIASWLFLEKPIIKLSRR